MIPVLAISHQDAGKTQILYSRAFFPPARKKIFLTLKKSYNATQWNHLIFIWGLERSKKEEKWNRNETFYKHIFLSLLTADHVNTEEWSTTVTVLLQIPHMLTSTSSFIAWSYQNERTFEHWIQPSQCLIHKTLLESTLTFPPSKIEKRIKPLYQYCINLYSETGTPRRN